MSAMINAKGAYTSVYAKDVFCFKNCAVKAIAVEALRTNLEVYAGMIGEEYDPTNPATVKDIKPTLETFRQSTKDMTAVFMRDLVTSVQAALDQVEFDLFVRRMDFDKDGGLADITLEIDVKTNTITAGT